jgi:hypothetical protein
MEFNPAAAAVIILIERSLVSASLFSVEENDMFSLSSLTFSIIIFRITAQLTTNYDLIYVPKIGMLYG